MTPAADNAGSAPAAKRPAARLPRHLRPICAALLLALSTTLPSFPATAEPAIPPGVWKMDDEVAIQIYDCDGLLCGRILWLLVPLDPQGVANIDKNNPDPALRWRGLCGMTIIWGLRQTGPDRWSGGGFYNPDDGKTYNVSAQLKSDDVVIARIYKGIPFFGKTKTLVRVPHGITAGWC